MEPFLHIHNDWRKMWHYCLYTLMIFEPWIWQHGQAGISCSSYEEAIFLCFKRLFAGIHIFKNKKINPDLSKQEQNISVIKALTHDWQLGKGKYKRSIRGEICWPYGASFWCHIFCIFEHFFWQLRGVWCQNLQHFLKIYECHMVYMPLFGPFLHRGPF